MDIRDELDRAAHIHGYEERDDDPPCSECVHQPMCSGQNCHFDRKWNPEDLEKKYYHVNDFDERLGDELYSMRDRAEQFTDWPHDLEGPYFTEKREWERNHPKKEFAVRVSTQIWVKARDALEARKLACKEQGVDEDDPCVDCNILYKYRMPVKYLCCEEGISWGYTYEMAKNGREARFKFMDSWIPDIESIPSFDDIEEYDPEGEEWNAVYTGRDH